MENLLKHYLKKCGKFSHVVFKVLNNLSACYIRICLDYKHSLLTNYRPISVLLFFSKIFEKIVYNIVFDFLCKNEILYDYQFGFILSARPEVRETADMDGGAYSPFRSIHLVYSHDFIIIQKSTDRRAVTELE